MGRGEGDFRIPANCDPSSRGCAGRSGRVQGKPTAESNGVFYFLTDRLRRRQHDGHRELRGEPRGRGAVSRAWRDAVREREPGDGVSVYGAEGGGRYRAILLARPLVRPGPGKVRPGGQRCAWRPICLRAQQPTEVH
jgi:hypothetical protein